MPRFRQIQTEGRFIARQRQTGWKTAENGNKAACDDFCQRKKEDWSALTKSGPVQDIAMTGAEHYNFTDSSGLYAPVLHPVGQLGPIDGARAIVITRDAVRAFVDCSLREEPASTVDATVGRYAELHAP